MQDVATAPGITLHSAPRPPVHSSASSGCCVQPANLATFENLIEAHTSASDWIR